MPTIDTPEGVWLFSLLLAAALVFPLRRLIFVLAMRRELRRTAAAVEAATQEAIPAGRQNRLQRRATISAVLLALIFSALYVHALAGRLAGAAS